MEYEVKLDSSESKNREFRMVSMDKKYLDILFRIFKKYPYSFYIFGSRARGTSKELSDIDIIVKEDIPLSDKCKLEEDFENSDLPFLVDLVVWDECSIDFQNSIKSQMILLHEN